MSKSNTSDVGDISYELLLEAYASASPAPFTSYEIDADGVVNLFKDGQWAGMCSREALEYALSKRGNL